MEEFVKRRSFDELRRVAAGCGLDEQDAFNDVADSMEVTGRLVPRSSQGEFKQLLAKWLFEFFQQYHSRCLERWLAKCGNVRDYEARERLWFDSFEPLWVAGCNVAKDLQLSNIRRVFISWRSIHPDNLTEADQKAWEAWFDRGVSQSIATFRETQRRAMANTLRDLEGYDNTSTLNMLSAEREQV